MKFYLVWPKLKLSRIRSNVPPANGVFAKFGPSPPTKCSNVCHTLSSLLNVPNVCPRAYTHAAAVVAAAACWEIAFFRTIFHHVQLSLSLFFSPKVRASSGVIF